MRYLALIAMLFWCAPVLAGWTYVTSTASGDDRFIDVETVRKEGNLRRVWQVINFEKPNQYGWSSQRGRIEIDCKNETVQVLSSMSFAEKFAGGKTLFEMPKSDSGGPIDIAPDSVMWAVMEKVCKSSVR